MSVERSWTCSIPCDGRVKTAVLAMAVWLALACRYVCLAANAYDTVGNSFIRLSDHTIYSLVQNQLWVLKSENGVFWQRLLEGHGIRSVAAVEHPSPTLYAVTDQSDLLISKDRGRRWTSVKPSLPSVDIRFVAVRQTPKPEVVVGTSKGLYRSPDGGLSWLPTGLIVPVVQFYQVAGGRAIALSDDGTVLVSSDDLVTWKPCRAGLPSKLISTGARTARREVSRVIRLLASGDGNGDPVFAQVEGAGLYVSESGGETWRPVGAPLAGTDNFWAVARDGPDLVLAGSRLLRYSQGRPSFINVKTAVQAIGEFFGIVSYGGSGRFLLHFRYTRDKAEVRRLGFLDISRGSVVGLDFGVRPGTPVASSNRPTKMPHIAVTDASGRLGWLALVDHILYFSQDSGYSWEPVADSCVGGGLAVNPRNPAEVWSFGEREPKLGPFNRNAPCAIVSVDGGRQWRVVQDFRFGDLGSSLSRVRFADKENLLYYSTGLNDYNIYRFTYDLRSASGSALKLALAAADFVFCDALGDTIFAGVGWLTHDGGLSWEDRRGPLKPLIYRYASESYYRSDVDLISCDGKRIVIATSTPGGLSAGKWQVCESPDLGSTWKTLGNRSEEEFLKLIPVGSAQGQRLLAIAAAPGSWQPKFWRLLQSADRGSTWTVLREEDTEIYDITVFQTHDTGREVFLLATRKGLFRSDDGGREWQPLGGVK
jgi:photosystem II stability/assembly factor-like uncharacterized protein